jgi:hypothetical protein
LLPLRLPLFAKKFLHFMGRRIKIKNRKGLSLRQGGCPIKNYEKTADLMNGGFCLFALT